MKYEEFHIPDGDRYIFDFDHCSYARGWCQLDTGQDARWFGTWINPEQRKILTYLEGDVHIVTADDDAELVQEVEQIKAWNLKAGYNFTGIDPGLDPNTRDRLKKAGLAAYVSGVEVDK
jgi:hypothetical protein